MLLVVFLPFLTSSVIRRPFVTAPHDVSRALGTSAICASSSATGGDNVRSTLNPQLPTLSPALSARSDPASINDKYFDLSVLSNCFDDNTEEFELFLSQVHFLEKLDISSGNNCKGVKGRLAKHIDFWVKIGASDFILDTIRNGYVIPF